MFKKILLPYDGLKTSEISVGCGVSLAKSSGAKLYVLHIISFDVFYSARACLKKSDAEVRKYCLERTKGMFSELTEEAKKAKINYEIRVVFAEDIINGISDFAEKEKIDLCILQPSLYYHSELTGDLAGKIARSLKIPTLFIKTKSIINKGARILVPIDEKEKNLVSMKVAIDIAKQNKGKIIFYHTTWRNREIETENAIEHCEKNVISCIALAKKAAEENNIESECVVEMAETIESGIIRCAVKNEVDLIIMTNSGAIIGGRAELVLDNSMYPLMIVKK